MRFSFALALALACGGCATSTGIIPVGPDTFTVSEMRAPALGGGPAAQRAVLAEASAFCAAGGRVVAPVFMRPDGDPYTPYYPTAYDATFRCVPPGAAGTEKAAGQ
jgi:hypothetical protein